MQTVWKFKTKRFRVSLQIERERGYQYDGDDCDGETQAALDSGELIAFASRVIVEFEGEEIGADYLGGSIYEADNKAAFWQDHRSADPMNRNCSVMRKARGEHVVICHYFPDMVRLAIQEARETMRERIEEAQSLPYIRAAA